MSSELSYSFVVWNGVSVAMCNKTIADVDDGFGDRAPACREYTLPRADSDSRICAAIPGSTLIGPVIQVHSAQFLGTHGIGIQIPSTTARNRISWVVICRGRNRYADGLHLRDSGQSHEYRSTFGKSVAKESELCSTELEKSRIGETHATQFENLTNPVYYSKIVILVGESKCNYALHCKSLKQNSLQAEIPKLVMRLVRRYDQDERQTNGAVHWNSLVTKLRKAFQKSEGRKFSDTHWLQHIYEGSNKMRFQYCMNSKKSLFHIRAI